MGLEIAKDVSDIIDEFPKHEKYDLASQMSRCSISIPSNISEGSSRTDRSFRHYLDISLGSSFELSTQLQIAHHKQYKNNSTLKNLEEKIKEWQMMTSGFQNGLRD